MDDKLIKEIQDQTFDALSCSVIQAHMKFWMECTIDLQKREAELITKIKQLEQQLSNLSSPSISNQSGWMTNFPKVISKKPITLPDHLSIKV